MFHYRGSPVGDFCKPWSRAATLAGLPGLLVHDLRRSAAKNLLKSGVPEVVAMKVTGHKTRSIFDRYCISSERDAREAAERVQEYLDAQSTERHVTTAEEAAKQAKKNSA